ncbi:MAG: hypothetical protein AAF789_00565 [Bacteroidota bacterium]
MDERQSLQEFERQVIKGFMESYKKLVDFKKSKNSPLVVTKGGKVVLIPPDEIPPTTEVIGSSEE